MRKLISTALAAAMILSLAACGSSSGSAASTTAAAAEAAETAAETGAEVELDWPKKTITIICPFSAGGATDLMARAVGEKLGERLGVSVIVDNKPGGSGSIGMSLLTASAADGYTIIITAMGPSCLSPYTSDVSYTPDDFAAICQLSDSPSVICVNSASGITTWEELLAKAEAEPGTFTIGNTGAGSAAHVAAASLALAASGDPDLFKHVAYGGDSEEITALLGGHIDATSTVYGAVSGYVESGDLTPIICVGADETPDYIPDIPTAAELGMDCTGGTWYIFAAPAATDQLIIDKLEEEILDIMATDEMVETFGNLNNPIVLLDQQETKEKWMSVYEQAGEILKSIGMIE